MADNSLKTPLGRSVNRLAINRATDEITKTGRSLPATVTAYGPNGFGPTIVRVAFSLTNTPYTLSQVNVPMLGSEYVRLPQVIGLKGFLIPADAYLGGVSGLGGGTADLTQRANLSTLVFAPIGNTGYASVADPNAVTIYGPSGVTLRDAANTASIKITANQITMTVGGQSVIVTSSGISIGGKDFATHKHIDVMPGSSDTGVVA